jgi:hypothetical protein
MLNYDFRCIRDKSFLKRRYATGWVCSQDLKILLKLWLLGEYLEIGRSQIAFAKLAICDRIVFAWRSR